MVVDIEPQAKPTKLPWVAVVGLVVCSPLIFFTSSLVAAIPAALIASYLVPILPRTYSQQHPDIIPLLIILLSGISVALVFCLWNLRLFSRAAKIPLRSILLYMLILAGTLYWHVKFFAGAFHYIGPTNAWIILALNLLLFILSTGMLIEGLSKPRFAVNLGFNFLLFIWLFYCAFPWYFGTM